MLYQSTSGDAELGTAISNMSNSYLTVTHSTDPVFYITNMVAVVYLTNVKIQKNTNLSLVAGAESWGVPIVNNTNSTSSSIVSLLRLH